MAESSKICRFYKDTKVLVTGGTGFLGKILIEKLLRSTDVSTIYVMIRPRKDKSAHQRLKELFDCEVFDRLKEECPKFEKKVQAISGDCSLSGFGLTIMDRQILISNINILFHVAATVKFDENLKRAFNINVNGTKDLINLARQMENLKSFVHVSTAYSHCHLTRIDEMFYTLPYTPEDVEALIEKLDEDEAAKMTPKILGQWPNTYTFTKALAESLIETQASSLPIGIFRPAVVISTYREPLPAWTDHFNGPAGVAAAAVSGVMRTLLCGRYNVADLVPVDACVAGLITVAWDIAQRKQDQPQHLYASMYPGDEIPIYNYVSSPENPITWNEFTQYTLSYGENYPARKAQWSPFMVNTSNILFYYLLKLFLHILPGLLIDTFTLLIGKKPKMMRFYSRLHKLSNMVSYFCVRSWNFSNSNTKKVWLKLNESDRDLFPMSITTVHWLIYVRNYISGVRSYLLKDPDCTLEAARKRAFWLNILNIIVSIVVIYGLFSLSTSMVNKLYNVIF